MNGHRIVAGFTIILVLVSLSILNPLYLKAESSGSKPTQIEIALSSNYLLAYIDWSRDGRYLATTYYIPGQHRSGLIIYDLEDGRIVLNRTSFPPVGVASGGISSLAWSPDGSILAVAVGVRYGRGGVLFYRFNESSPGNLTLLWYTTTPGPRWIEWSHDGSKVALAYDYYSFWSGPTKNIQVYSRNGTLIWGKTIRYEYLWTVGWSPDDSLIAVGGRTSGWSRSIPGYYNGRIHVLNASNGNELWSKTIGAWVYGSTWLDNPTRLLVSGNTGTIKVFDANGNLLKETAWLGHSVRKMNPSPDGSRLAVGVLWDKYGIGGSRMGRLIVLNTSDLSILWERRFPDIGVIDPKWNSDGSMIALGGRDGKLRIIDKHGGIVGESPPFNSNITGLSYYHNNTFIILGTSWLSKYMLPGGVVWNRSLGVNVTGLEVDKRNGLIIVGGYNGSNASRLLVYSPDGQLKSEIPLGERVTGFSLQERLGLIGLVTGSGKLVVTTEDGHVQASTSIGSPGEYHVKWSQCLPFIAVYNNSRLAIYAYYGSSMSKIWEYTNDTVYDVSWNPVNSYLSLLHGNETSRTLTTYDYLFRYVWSRSVPLYSYALEWSPKGGRVAVKTKNYIYVWDYNGSYLWKTATFDIFNRNTNSPASIGSITWNDKADSIAAITYGSTWVSVFYTGPYSSPTPLLSNSTSSTVGGVLLPTQGTPGNSTGELAVASSILLAALLVMSSSRAWRR